MRTILCILFFYSLRCSAQYPFEKCPAVKSKEYKNWKSYDKLKEENKIDYTLRIPKFFNDTENVTVQLTGFPCEENQHSIIRIFRGKKQIQKFNEAYELGSMFDPPQSIFAEDINGDSLMDMKILIPYYGCGGYNYYLTVIYLFQKHDGTFTNISFEDLMMGFENRLERDIDGDGNFEIITQTFQSVGIHNYWLFNLYNFNGKDLVNVNYMDNYPIMTQILWCDNFVITNKIPQKKMKKFALKLPDDYSRK